MARLTDDVKTDIAPNMGAIYNLLRMAQISWFQAWRFQLFQQ